MKFTHGFRTILTAALAAALLGGSALAASVAPAPISAPPVSSGITAEDRLESCQPVRVYGKATAIAEVKNGSRILLENSNDKDPNQKIDVLVSDMTMILDAVTGAPKTMKDISKGESLYAYVGPAMTMSLPPQASATLVLCNIPADYAVPKYAQVKTVTEREDGGVDVLMTGSVLLHLNKDTELLAYRTDNAVTMGDITPGAHLLSWYSAETRSIPAQATPGKVMVFPLVANEDTPITRGAFMDLLYASAKSPAATAAAPFADADSAALRWAAEQKIATGTGATKFNPEDTLTREQMMVFLLRYATALEKGPVGAWATRITYQDMTSLSSWAVEGAMWNQMTGLVKPDGENNIRPAAPVTRAEADAAIAGLLAR
ncbi:MAG: S-layer homology domain-containing protein [Pseudoflavonifractor sp.]